MPYGAPVCFHIRLALGFINSNVASHNSGRAIVYRPGDQYEVSLNTVLGKGSNVVLPILDDLSQPDFVNVCSFSTDSGTGAYKTPALACAIAGAASPLLLLC